MDLASHAVVFLLTFGTVARATRFVNDDRLADGFRAWIERRFGRGSQVYWLVNCAWCLSIWFALTAAVVLAATGNISWWAAVPYAFTVSYLYGLTAKNLDS